MSWYKQAQQSRSLIQQGLGTAANPAGILVSYQDYMKLKGFGPGSGPITVLDKDTNSNVTVIHGGLTPDGRFGFATGTGDFVFPNEDDKWAQKLNVNPGNYIVSCYQGAAKAGDFKSATNYRGKLELQTPVSVQDTTQDVRVLVSGG
jgi:hypothetical protein